MKISFVTFGCRLNQAEALDLEAQLSAAGHTIIPVPKGSDPTVSPKGSDPTVSPKGSDPIAPKGSDPIVPEVIVVRGCSVTDKAYNDCEKMISKLKSQFPNTKIVRMGCLPNATTLPQFLSTIEEKIVGSKIVGSDPSEIVGSEIVGSDPSEIVGSDPSKIVGSDPSRSVSMSTSRAYLKIQDGCSGKCAFCIVPQFRGPPISTPFNEIMVKAQSFLSVGYRELVVTGCNLALYKCDGKGLADILDALAKIKLQGSDPIEGSDPMGHTTLLQGSDPTEQGSQGSDPMGHRIRIGSIEPGLGGTGILDIMSENKNICRFLHISLQSGSNEILKRMNRPYDIETVTGFVADARLRFGMELCLGADVITGFPGESEVDFEATRSFLAKWDFCNVHVFPYSERPGTMGAKMKEVVPIAVRKKRAKIISEDARMRKLRFAERFVGREVEVCVERGGDHGWTGEYLPVQLNGVRPRRSLVRVRIVSAENGILLPFNRRG